MKHVPSGFRADVPKLPADAADEEFDAWMEALPPCPGILYVDDDDEEGEAAALAELEAEGGVPHAIVAEWLKTWGKPGRLPFDDWFAARNG